MSFVVLGHFMLLDSSKGQTGDQVTLLSPKLALSVRSLLKFSFQMLLNDTDTDGTLTVYRYTQLHVYDAVLFQVRGNRGVKWLSQEICLRTGEYQLAFVGTIGLASLSDIAIDNIKVTKGQDCDEQDSSPSEGLAICVLIMMTTILIINNE